MNEGSINRLESGLYCVVPVFCTERGCVNWDTCHDGKGNCDKGVCGEVGLQEKDSGCSMICHEYLSPLDIKERDKKVFWARKMVG
jgi:hypothetical protein